MPAKPRVILVPVDRASTNEARLHSANDLARQIEAKVIGVMACAIPAPVYYVAGALTYDPIEEECRRLHSVMAEQEARFRNTFEAPHTAVEWRSAVAEPTDFILGATCAADLIVSWLPRNPNGDEIDRAALVLRAGRPVLFLGAAPL
jgi:hypothetical protein